MKLYEMLNTGEDNPYYDGEKDNSPLQSGDTRKSKLTLGQINSLRKMYDAKRFEKSQMIEKIKAQYGAQSGEDSNL